MPLVLMVVHPDDDVATSWLAQLHGAGHVAQRAELENLPPRPSLLDGVWVQARLPASEVEALRRWAGPQVSVKLREDGADQDQSWFADLARTTRVVQIGPVTVDLRRGLLQRDQSVQTLTDIESALLAWMAQQPGHVFSRQELLEAVWGYSARMQTRVVDVTVARVRAKLEAEASKPEWLITVRGKGYRLDGVAAPVASTGPAELEVDVRGRGQLWSVLQEWLGAGEPVITLLGPPGIGKTRLAQEVARVHDRAAWCELGAASTERDALMVVARALGLPPDSAEAEVAKAIHAGTGLVILDNAEHVHGLVGRLVQGNQTSTVLVTSRLRLAVPRERCLDLTPLERSDAQALFLDRARRQRADFEADAATLEAVVDACEGLPLALELAAAQVRVLSGRDLARALTTQRVRDRSRRLGHRTYHEALASSWGLLSTDERHGLSVLGHLRGRVPASLLDHVLEDGLGVLQGLHDASLVHIDPRPRGSMVRLLETVRRFVRDTEPLSPEAALQLAERLAVHTERLDARARGEGGWDALHALGDLQWALHDASRGALAAGKGELATRLALSFAHRLEVWGPHRADIEMLEALPDHADVQRLLALLLPQVGRTEDAVRCADRAIALADTQEKVAEGVYARTLARYRLGELNPRPLEFALDDLSGLPRARAHIALSLFAKFRADLHDADAHLRSALSIADRLRVRWLAAEILTLVAALHDVRGEHRLATARGQEALQAYTEHDVQPRITLLQSVVASSLIWSGRAEEAKAFLAEAIEACEAQGQSHNHAILLQRQIRACLETGDVDGAEDAIGASVRLTTGDGLFDDMMQAFRGQIAMARGQFAAALEVLDPLQTSHRHGTRRDAAYFGTLCALALGDAEGARARLAHPDAPDVLLHLVGVARSMPPTQLPPTAMDAERAWSHILGGPDVPNTPRGAAMVTAAADGTPAAYAEVETLLALRARKRARQASSSDSSDTTRTSSTSVGPNSTR